MGTGVGAAMRLLLRRMPKFTFGIETESVSTLVSISILLPFFSREDLLLINIPELKSFDELSKFSVDLKKGIELPVIEKEIQGQVEIVSAGNGSIVLYVTLGTILAVKLIAGVCWAAAVIRKKNVEANIFEQHAKTLKLKMML
ncbi:MAG: hypothetical protein KGZ74_02345 [Chitinophagaceae bacterium]|nr:hypothetical protein [Chitinophagaceae bacterium]